MEHHPQPGCLSRDLAVHHLRCENQATSPLPTILAWTEYYEIDCAEQSQLGDAGTTGLAPSKRDEGTPHGVTTSAGDCAKQSQLADAGTMGLASSKRDEGTPDGVTTNEGGSCETKPIELVGVACSVPVRASLETQDVASLQDVGTSEADCAKQSQSPPIDGVHGTPYESGHDSARGETPHGVTTSADECAKQSQSPHVDGVHGTPYESGDTGPGEGTPYGVTTSAGDSAKQGPSIRHAPLVAAEGHAREIRVSPA